MSGNVQHIHLASGQVLKRGLKPTPRHKLCGATPHRITGSTPSQVIVVPPHLDMWLNNQYGSCVSTEEAFSKAAYSVMCGQPELFITNETLMAFCRKYDLLDGAMLDDVMNKMKADGFHQDGQTYTDGPYNSVDYSNEAVLQNALSIGPVKIGIDANALPQGAGNGSGWYGSGGHQGQYPNEDHCVGLCGFGPSIALFAALGRTQPSNFPANGYLLFTWGGIGVVDHAWIMSTCAEAWVRNPTTPGTVPVPPVPPTPPVPPAPHVIHVSIPQQPVMAGSFHIGHVPAFTVDVNLDCPKDLGFSLIPWAKIIAAIEAFIVSHAGNAVPYIEAYIAKLPLPAWAITVLDKIVESLLGTPVKLKHPSC